MSRCCHLHYRSVSLEYGWALQNELKAIRADPLRKGLKIFGTTFKIKVPQERRCELDRLLTSSRLKRHTQCLNTWRESCKAGFGQWKRVLGITEYDLELLSVRLRRRRKLWKEIANAKQLAHDPDSVTLSYGQAPAQQILRARQFPPIAVDLRRGYKPRLKPDPDAPQRLYSAYILFSNHIHV